MCYRLVQNVTFSHGEQFSASISNILLIPQTSSVHLKQVFFRPLAVEATLLLRNWIRAIGPLFPIIFFVAHLMFCFIYYIFLNSCSKIGIYPTSSKMYCNCCFVHYKALRTHHSITESPSTLPFGLEFSSVFFIPISICVWDHSCWWAVIGREKTRHCVGEYFELEYRSFMYVWNLVFNDT